MTPARSLLQAPIQFLKGVGPRRAERFAQLGVRTGRDLLFHLPYRYEDATTVNAIADIAVGSDVTVIGRVMAKGVLPVRSGLRVFRAVIRDETGRIECAWFGRPWLDRSIHSGDLLLVNGTVSFFHGLQLRPREYTVLARGGKGGGHAGGERAGSGFPAGTIFPVYHATQGLAHREVRVVVQRNLKRLLDEAGNDPLPSSWLESLTLPPLPEALGTLHQPRSLADIAPAQRRLAYEELFFLQLLHARARLRARSAGISFRAAPRLTNGFLESLPFRLTGAQRRAWEEIEADMGRRTPMNRLLQGDVGCGKTVVALLALLKAVEAGYQAAIMAPTELLADQHLRTFEKLIGPLGVDFVLLAGAVTGKARQRAMESIASGSAKLAVGTHALIQESVDFASLGCVVIDEQHRFGVEQRLRLRENTGASTPDVLVMSATPIPRSLALVAYGDLDLSVIDELPPGRRRVTTAVRGPISRDAAFDFLGEKLAEGQQAYVVYPLIEESEALEARAATAMFEDLEARYKDFSVRLLHGRMSSAEKDDAMRSFQAGDTQLLVCTTVIEVGIDVPNATVMLIEDAERFGLAQLHQLRGRVGRGAERSYCIAFGASAKPSERLRAFAEISNGFELAEADLRIRGQGDLFGKEQHGAALLRFADLCRDRDLLEDGRKRARAIVAADPELSRPEHRKLRGELELRYARREALSKIG